MPVYRLLRLLLATDKTYVAADKYVLAAVTASAFIVYK